MDVTEEGGALGYTVYANLDFARSVVRHFVAMVGFERDDLAILDIGSGTGDSARAILETLFALDHWKGAVSLLEPDTESLRIAEDHLAGQPVLAHRGSAENCFSFSERSFDVSIWSNGIHYLESQASLMTALRAIHHATRRKFVAWSTFFKEAYCGKTTRFAGLWVAKAYELLGVNRTERVRSNNLQVRGQADYEAAFREAGFSRVRSALQIFELGPEVYRGIAMFQDYAERALPAMPDRPDLTIEKRSQALVEAVEPIYHLLGASTLPRYWLYMEAEP